MTQNAPTIAFVARGLTAGGVGRFVTSLLEVWDKQAQDDVSLVIFTDDRRFVSQYSNLTVIYIPPAPKFIWDNLLLWYQLRTHNPQSVVYTKNVIPWTHLASEWEKIVVVYDLAFYYPELKAYKWFNSIYMRVMAKWTLGFANRIITISKFTKKEIIKFLHISSERIKVIYLGVSPEFRRVTNRRRLADVKRRYNLQLPFIFYVGSLSPRKNILRLIMAFHKLADKIPHHLYLVSGRRWNSPEVERYIRQNHLDHRIHLLPHLPEKDLISFYTLASALVYPTLYEGFGLPVIEALACGCVAVVSKSIPVREVSIRNVIDINPTQINSLSLGIVKAVRRRASKASSVRSWEMVAEEYIDIIKKTVQNAAN